jgi:hypothetical protein
VPPDAKGSDAANPRGPPDGLRALIPEEARGALAAVRESALADLPSLKVTELDKPHADVLARIGPAVNALKRTTAADRNAAFAAAKAAQDKTDAYLRWYTSAVAVRRHPFPLSARDVLDVEGAALTGVPVEEFTLSGTPGLEPFGAVVGGTVFVRPVAAGPAVELGFVPRELVRVAVRRAAGKDGATADGVLEAVRGGWAKGGPTAADIALALADVIDELCYARPDPTIFSVATDGTVTFTDWDGKARSLRPTSPVPDPVDGAGGDEPRQTGGEFDPRPDTSFDPRNPPPVPVPAEVKPIEQSGPAGYEWLDLSERDAGGRRVDQALLAASTTLSKLRPDLPQADPSVAAAVAALGKIDLPFGDAVKAVAVLSAKPEPRK